MNNGQKKKKKANKRTTVVCLRKTNKQTKNLKDEV